MSGEADTDGFVAAFRTVEVSEPRFESDGLRLVTVKSAALRQRADITVHVPEAAASGRDVPLVILLHGVYGSHWAWTAKGGAHRTADRLRAAGEIPPFVLAMPSDGLWGDGSGYVPHAAQDFERWIVDDVPAAVAHAAPGVTPRSPVFLTGLSMGGYGALRLGGKHRTRFRGVSAHSAITRLEQMQGFVSEPASAYRAVPPAERAVADVLRGAGEPLPPLRFDCGTDDPLLEANRTLHRELTAAGIAHGYAEFPGGHTWPYWETHLADSLRFFAGLLRRG